MTYLLYAYWPWLALCLLGGIVIGWGAYGLPRKAALSRLGLPVLAVAAALLLIAVLALLPGRAGLLLDTALLFVAAYLIGCVLGAAIRKGNAAQSDQPPAALGLVPAASVKPYSWQAQKDGNALTLSGQVPTEALRRTVLAEAQKLTAEQNVVDKQEIIPGGAPAGLADAAAVAFAHLARLKTGIASLSDRDYTLTGIAASTADYDALLNALKTMPAGFALWRADIARPEEKPAQPAAKPAAKAPPKPAAKPAAKPAKSSKTAEASQAAEPLPAPKLPDEDKHAGKRPAGYVSPRAGAADDLKLIVGIGPKNEAALNKLGIWHFSQIAAWKRAEIDWVGSYLAFPGRIDREKWVAQAKDFAKKAT